MEKEKLKEAVSIVAKLAIIYYIYEAKDKKFDFIKHRIKKLDKKVIPLIFIEIVNQCLNKEDKDLKIEEREDDSNLQEKEKKMEEEVDDNNPEEENKIEEVDDNNPEEENKIEEVDDNYPEEENKIEEVDDNNHEEENKIEEEEEKKNSSPKEKVNNEGDEDIDFDDMKSFIFKEFSNKLENEDDIIMSLV